MKAEGKLSSSFTINYQKTGTHNAKLVIDWTPVWILILNFFSRQDILPLSLPNTHAKLFSTSCWHIICLISLLITLLSLIYQHVCTAGLHRLAWRFRFRPDIEIRANLSHKHMAAVSIGGKVQCQICFFLCWGYCTGDLHAKAVGAVMDFKAKLSW